MSDDSIFAFSLTSNGRGYLLLVFCFQLQLNFPQTSRLYVRIFLDIKYFSSGISHMFRIEYTEYNLYK